MLLRRLYYTSKPYLPWRARITARRVWAGFKRRKHSSTWPINEAAGRVPNGWPGWPDGQQLAFVLTHDVESAVGLGRVRALAELEMSLGFRSSFGFVPEGGYEVPPVLLEWLVRNGFEVVVHDLHHNGSLYQSRAAFARQAFSINQYLQKWGAVGFRSGFMLRQLEWLQMLNIEYDASTFDTDPFEPQPDGAGTIFPYWVPSRDGSRGFVELPYTLVQDFNLFTVLRERDAAIWHRKLSWIAEKGGMALLDTHPDYMTLPNVNAARGEFPIERYGQFLKTVRERWEGHFWHPLPKEIARFARSVFKPASDGLSCVRNGAAANGSEPAAKSRALAGRRAAVVLYSYYPADPRPRRAAESLVREGMEVELICLREAGEPKQETINGVAVTRVPMKRRRTGKLTYGIQYLLFGLAASARLSWRSLTRRYDVVHVHNMPDALVFSALLPKLRGARVILDLHDPMPELMMSIYNLERESRAVRLLTRIEKWSTGFADVVLTVNEACRKIFTARSCPSDKVRVIMNAPDEDAFKLLPPAGRGPERRNGCAHPFVLMYHGSLVERHGLDIAVNAVAQLKQTIPNLELRVYGKSSVFLEQVMAGVRDRGLESVVKYLGPKTVQQIAEAIVECDLGIVPNRRSLFTEINTPTRIFEYLSRGRPVIAPRASGIQDYFRDEELVYFKLGDQQDLEKQIRFVFAEPERVRAIVEAGQKVYLHHCWSRERERFLDTVGELVAN